MKNWILFISTLFALQSFAQQNDPANWAHYESVEKVKCYAETDTEIWLGTAHGLVIVNKNTLEKEIFNQFNSNLPADDIEAIVFDANGTPFIGTYDYVVAMYEDGEWVEIEVPIGEETFGNQPPRLYDIELAADGSLWVATNNGLWQQKDEVWTVINKDTPGFPSQFFGEVWEVEEDAAGNIWFISFELFRFDGEELVVFNDNGNQIMGFYGGGTLECRGDKLLTTNQFSFIAEIQGDSIRLADLSNNDVLPNNTGWLLNIDENDQMNFIFRNGERYIYDWENFTPANNELTPLLMEGYEPPYYEYVQQYFYDADGRIWATQGTTVHQLENTIVTSAHLSEVPLIYNGFKDFAEAPDGSVYILDLYYNMVRFHPDNGWEGGLLPDLDEPYLAYRLTFDDNGVLWVGTNIGLLRWDGETWELFNGDNSDYPNDYAGKIVTSISGDMYVATGEGVAHFNGENWNFLTSDNSGLLEGSTQNMATNDAGHLWITREQTVHFYDGETWTYFDENNSNIQHYIANGNIIPIANDDVWMSVNGGVYHYNGTDWTFFGVAEGLTSSPIDITIDPEGKIWAACYEGLGVFDGENWEMWTTDNSQLVNDKTNKIYSMSDGTIWLNTLGNGIMSYDQGLVLNVFNNARNIQNLTVFPNPTTNFIMIDKDVFTGKEMTYEILTATGQEVAVGILQGNLLQVDQLVSGAYYLRLSGESEVLVGGFQIVK